LSPFVFLSWIISGIITIIYILLFFPITIIFLPLLSITQLWGVLFELPSSYINKNKTLNINHFGYNDKDDWTHVVASSFSLFSTISIIGIINDTLMPTYISGGILFFATMVIIIAMEDA
jgi:hypothetical protein